MPMDAAQSFAAGYEKGYDAGLAAARRQLERENADAKVTARSPQSAESGESSLQTRESSGTALPAAGVAPAKAAKESATEKPIKAPGMSEAIETETSEPPSPDETASLSLEKAGMPGSLRGSLASLQRQNARLDGEGLERILDEADLSSRIEHGLLVPLPASAALTVNPDLIANHRYCREWTARFLADLARAHAAEFHKPIQVNSAVRTVEYQKRLMRTNGNAADAEGDIVSPHLTGATIDIAKQGLSRKELTWMRRRLLGLQEAGKIDVEEEFAQACFHITVYKSYVTSLPRTKAGRAGASQAGTSEGTGTGRKAAKPASHLPADIAAGEFGAQGR